MLWFSVVCVVAGGNLVHRTEYPDSSRKPIFIRGLRLAFCRCWVNIMGLKFGYEVMGKSSLSVGYTPHAECFPIRDIVIGEGGLFFGLSFRRRVVNA
jgi:hypothetical protein